MIVSVHRQKRAAVAAALAVSMFVPSLALAQATPPPTPEPGQKVAQGEEEKKPTRRFFPALFHNLGDDLKHVPRKNSLYWLGAGTAFALAVHPYDDNINAYFLKSGRSGFFKPGKVIGSLPVLLGTGVTTWAVGRHKHQPRAQHIGMDLIESALLSEGFVEGIKFSVRRERPVREDGTRASGYAFPSGHSTMSFAAATVMQQHLGWKWAVPTYTFASYVATSRMHDIRHWASDVAFGAGLGIIIGRSVTWHGRNFYASPMLLPKGAGVMVNVRP